MNFIKGEVPLKLSDGREFVLVMDFEALVQAESAYGKPLPVLMADAAAGFVGANRALLFGALMARHPRTTIRDASAMFMHDGDAVTIALEKAAQAAFPDKQEGGDSANPPGKRSGRSGAKRG